MRVASLCNKSGGCGLHEEKILFHVMQCNKIKENILATQNMQRTDRTRLSHSEAAVGRRRHGEQGPTHVVSVVCTEYWQQWVDHVSLHVHTPEQLSLSYWQWRHAVYLLIWLIILTLPYLTLDLSSSRVKDTFGHTSTPAFSVDSELLRYFPGHADAFQILLYGVYPVLSWSSRLSLWTDYIPVYNLCWQSVVVHPQNVPEPSQSSLFYDEIYLLQLCLRPDPLVTDFVFPWDTHYSSLELVMCGF